MRKTAMIALATLLALMVRPLQLPAASCILSNAPSEKPCKMHCCANKTCCAKSKGSSAPVSQPLQSADAKQQLVLGIVSVPVIDSTPIAISPPPTRENLSVRPHSPPPLAANCIRLI